MLNVAGLRNQVETLAHQTNLTRIDLPAPRPATARITFSYYVYDEAPGAPRSVDEIVFRRWLCSCGQGGYALDAATFRARVLSHWHATHGRAPATVVADLRHCTDELLAFVERQVL